MQLFQNSVLKYYFALVNKEATERASEVNLELQSQIDVTDREIDLMEGK